MDITLIHSVTGESRDHFKHGIGILSSILKPKGHKVTLSFDPMAPFPVGDIVGISGLSSSIDTIHKLVQIVRARERKRIPIFVGGPAATLSAEFLEANEDIDFIFKGEGEITFTKIVDDYEKDDILPSERIIVGEPVCNLDSVPFTDRGKFFRSGEPRGGAGILFGAFGPDYPMYSMFNSRFCSKKCKYCAPAMPKLFGGKKKLRSVDNFMKELLTFPVDKMLIAMWDDNFLENHEWVEEFYEQMIKRDLYIPFNIHAHPVDIAKRKDTLAKLMEIGLFGVASGFESGSDRLLRYMKKGSTVEWNIKAAKTLKELGVNTFANLMYGLPTETPEEMKLTTEFYNDCVHESGRTFPSPATYTPLPGSTWYYELRDAGEIIIDDYSNFEIYPWTVGKLKSIDYDAVKKNIDELHRERIFD